MSRIARQRSQSQIYHIMLRGSNKQEIFHDDEDCVKFLEILAKYKQKSNMKVYGWCLMGNHVHLLLAQGDEDISITMKRIGVSYAWHYNWKYNTTGHLFQDRFRSEKIEDEKYLLAVIRYIHQNPVKAAISTSVCNWKWSSCREYYGSSCYTANLTDTDFIQAMFSQDKHKAENMFKEFNEAEHEDKCLDYEERKRLTDEQARKEINRVIDGYEIAGIKSLIKAERAEVLKKIKKIEGLSQRQVARIIGVSQTIICKA